MVIVPPYWAHATISAKILINLLLSERGAIGV